MDIQKTLKEYNIDLKNKHLVVGVSGGPDSMCLLNLLHSLKERLNLKLDVCHINYKLRGVDSDEDEKLVKRICNDFLINFHIFVFNSQNKTNFSENLFRNVRYNFFEEIRDKIKADFIAVAHNADDQAETIIMKFLRGASFKGLSGMKIRSRHILRPLLCVKRKDILNYMEENKIDFRIDKTNLETNYLRNKVRNNLIPLLEAEYNPNLKDTLVRNAGIMGNINNFVQNYANLLFPNISRVEENYLEIDYKKWIILPEALKYETIKISLEIFLGELTDISCAQISEIINMLTNKISFGEKLINGLLIQEKYDKIIIKGDKLNK